MIVEGCIFCGSHLLYGDCPVCRATDADQREAHAIEQARAYLIGHTVHAQVNYCAECRSALKDYTCPKCDADLVRDITTEYHPYLWEMDAGDQINAHALGVAL